MALTDDVVDFSLNERSEKAIESLSLSHSANTSWLRPFVPAHAL
jgi:hypothetical protein